MKQGYFAYGWILAAFIMALPGVAWAQDNPLSSGISAEPVLPDPVPTQGANYPPSAATATTAYGGPPRFTPAAPCSALNPCALPSSAPHKLGPLVGSGD